MISRVRTKAWQVEQCLIQQPDLKETPLWPIIWLSTLHVFVHCAKNIENAGNHNQSHFLRSQEIWHCEWCNKNNISPWLSCIRIIGFRVCCFCRHEYCTIHVHCCVSKACGPFMVTFFINTKLYLKVCSLGVHLRMGTKKTCLKEIGLMLSF